MARFHWYLDAYRGLSTQIWLLALVSFVNRAGTMVIPFLSIYLTSELGYSLYQTAIIMAAFGAGSVAGVFAGGRLTDLWGYHKVQYLSLLGSGISFMVLAHVQSLVGLIIAIFITTLLADAFRPASMASISSYSSEENRTRSVSLVRLAINFGFSIGPVAGGLIVAQLGYFWIFYIDGITCILAALLVIQLLLDIPISRDEEEKTQGDFQSDISPYRDKRFLVYCFFTFLLAFMFFQLFTSVPTYWKTDLNIEEDDIGWLFMINGLLLALIEVPLVYYLEHKFRLIYLIIAGTFLVGLGFVIFAAYSSILGMAIGMLIFSIGEIGSLPFSTSLALKMSKPKTRGQYMSIYGFSFSGAQLVGPSLGLGLAGWVGFPILFQGIFMLGLITCVGFYFIRAYGDKN